jgi:hypothetical protein
MDLAQEFDAIKGQLSKIDEIKQLINEGNVPQWVLSVEFNTSQAAKILGWTYDRLNRKVNRGDVPHKLDGTRAYFTYNQLKQINPAL